MFSLLQQVPDILLPAALLCAALFEAGWSHSMELLGGFHPNMVVEVVSHHRRFCGHRGVGPQSPVQVESCVDLLQVVVAVCRKLEFLFFPPQDRRGDMCGVQSDADRCGPPCAVVDV